MNEIYTKLKEQLARLNEQLAMSQKARRERENVIRQLNEVSKSLDDTEFAISELNKCRLNINHYVAKRKEESLTFLNDNLSDIAYYVSSADVQRVEVKMDDKSGAYIVNERGLPITGREGGAVKSLADLIIRAIMLKYTNTDFKVILLDESLSALSDETAVKAADLLNDLKKEFLIIGIEQRNTTYANIADKVYSVRKHGTESKVEEVS